MIVTVVFVSEVHGVLSYMHISLIFLRSSYSLFLVRSPSSPLVFFVGFSFLASHCTEEYDVSAWEAPDGLVVARCFNQVLAWYRSFSC